MAGFKNPDVWKKNLAYQIGDFVLYNGTVYMAIKPVPAGTDMSADYWIAFAEGAIVPTGEISITENGEINVAQYATANVNVEGGGGGEDNEFIAALTDADGFKSFTGTLSIGEDEISYTVETFFAGTEHELEAAVASVPVGSIVTYAPVQGNNPATDNSMMYIFESEEAFLSGTAAPILNAKISDSVIVPAVNFLVAMFNVTK